MIKVGSLFKAKDFEGYTIKILKKEGNKYKVRFHGPKAISETLPYVDDVVTEQYIRQRYVINEKK